MSAGAPPPRNDAPFAFVPDLVWTPIAAGLLTLVCGGMGLLFHQLWLFPSIGPTAMLMAHSPELPSARFHNTLTGHLIGLGAGYLALAACGGLAAPALFGAHVLVPVRMWASVLAVALTLFVQTLAHAEHPPAAATTLLAALGGFRPTWHDAADVAAGVLLVALAGEVLRHLRVHLRARRAGPSVGQSA